VHAVRAGEAVAVAAEVRRLDPRQVGLERDPAVVLASVEERARERDRGRVVLLVLTEVRPRPRPVQAVRRALEVDAGAGAASDLDECRITRVEAWSLVVIGPVGVGRARTGAAAVGGGGRAVLEVADLVRERDVVAVRRPRDTRVLAGA